MTEVDAARGHAAATLYEAAAGDCDCACEPVIHPAWPGARVAGAAFTVQGIGGDNLALHQAVLAAPFGSVIVADLQGAAFGHWGEILAVAAQARGVCGLVLDGGVRDVDALQRLRFPVFARLVAIRGTSKEHLGEFQKPVRIGGQVVRPGDLIVGDADGVVALPAALIGAILDRADARAEDEARTIEVVKNGTTTVELFGLRRDDLNGGPARTG